MMHATQLMGPILALGLLAMPLLPAAAAAPDKLTILFPDGSSRIGDTGVSTLDQASRLYRAGNPIVMIVTGATDATGDASHNLVLSERRARAVLDGLVERGVPIAKLQLLAAGSTVPAVDAPAGAAAPDNRRVEISWR